ncbi:hypothetical protein GPALN_013229 [Globodera pallida]|nr:hypothetical protein GPALN_013229 [Globodera pallida]
MESPEVSQRISFKGASPPDTSQRSTRMVQYVPKNEQSAIKKMFCPVPLASEHVQNDHTTNVMPLNNSQWISHILDQSESDQTAAHGGLASMRSMWEDRISEETEQKEREELINAALFARRQFLFPKWRSVDPLTASLVASHKTQEMIPVDSRIPQYRQQRLMETERMAPYAKLELHQPYIEQEVCKQLQKDAKRMFVPARPKNPEQMARARASELLYRQQRPWYDLDEIRQQISHESIANVGTTRQLFEHHSDLLPEEREIRPRRAQLRTLGQQIVEEEIDQNAIDGGRNGTFSGHQRVPHNF